ncbi:alanine:cation symporter family protein [Nonomuraea longispora]|uniref:Alanine:cation symporter family protein n=1 Tax=Nonomuraea longispora TaxID=1848320 RepID=A0A4R4NFM4_9ACTN|nr:alanine/glycine:cation symporter family protein [Nonomuraea longispora]TDC07825.1 alanine:cation symporter family protein [Nonomuraea longispora]
MDAALADITDGLWTYLLIPVVVLLGLFFTIQSKGVQFRMFPEMFRAVARKSAPDREGGRPVSSFGAFTISAAARVGTGNVAGVAAAITLGGPGAVFWMWVMAVIGAASAFAESTLAQLYKVRDKGSFRGGPAYYMRFGLNAKWMGMIFAAVITLTFALAFNSVQANTISATMVSAFGMPADSAAPSVIIGLALVALTALVVFGGVTRLVSVTTMLVPVMAIVYLLLGGTVVIMNIQNIPTAVSEIVSSAFGFEEMAAGGLGAAIMQGVRRGLFSNEAGLGSAPNAGAAASVRHPVNQGLVQALGVFFDTILVCSLTAFTILFANPTLAGNDETGANLTQSALVTNLGSWAGIALAVVIFMLAFSSVLGNYYYGESNVEFLVGRKGLPVLRVLVLIAVFVGAVGSFATVWAVADLMMALLALINLAALAPLSKTAFKLLGDYVAQRRAGVEDPVFTKDRMPELRNVQVWDSADAPVKS